MRIPFRVRYSDARGDATTAENELVFTANLPSVRRDICFPEISLVAAIFEDAVRCARRSNGSVTHRDSSDAVEWIASERSDWPFAFVNVCNFLGVDAQVVRARLGRVAKSHIEDVLRRSDGDRRRASISLGVDLSTHYRKMNELDVD